MDESNYLELKFTTNYINKYFVLIYRIDKNKVLIFTQILELGVSLYYISWDKISVIISHFLTFHHKIPLEKGNIRHGSQSASFN